MRLALNLQSPPLNVAVFVDACFAALLVEQPLQALRSFFETRHQTTPSSLTQPHPAVCGHHLEDRQVGKAPRAPFSMCDSNYNDVVVIQGMRVST